jgi:hypothetical protein
VIGSRTAQRSIDQIRRVMRVVKGERHHRTTDVRLRKLRRTLHEFEHYLSSQNSWLVNFAQRHRGGLRAGTAVTEGTPTFLVDQRMTKLKQMRWTRRGADLLLQTRCAVYNGALGSAFGQKFQPANDPYLPMVLAARSPISRQAPTPQSCLLAE